MKRATPLALMLALLLTAPTVVAAREAPQFPDDLKPLVGRWLDQATQVGASHGERSWYPNASRFLQEAGDAHAAGRLRVAMYDLETFYELVRAGEIMDQAAALSSDADRKSLALERTSNWRDDANNAWSDFRAALHIHDGKLRSLHSLERALFAADAAVLARIATNDFDALAREFPKQSTFDEGYVLALVRASHTSLLNLRWASDILATLGGLEGLEPRINETAWNVLTTSSLTPRSEEDQPPHLKPYEALAKDVRANGEGILAVAIDLGELRAARSSSIFVIFGDARSRGKDVVGDAARNMDKQLANTTIATPRGFGLQGLFTADAIDRATYVMEFFAKGPLELGIVVGAWSSLDHATYVTSALSQVSPIQPPPPGQPAKETPIPAFVAIMALVAVAATLRRRA